MEKSERQKPRWDSVTDGGDDTLLWFYFLEFCQALTVNIRKNKDCISGCCCCYVTSVVSDSVRPHRQQPTRLPRPWDSPGRNTGVGCHFLLQCMKVKVKVKSLSHDQLFLTPWTAAHQAPSSMGFSRQEHWSGLPFLVGGWEKELFWNKSTYSILFLQG